MGDPGFEPGTSALSGRSGPIAAKLSSEGLADGVHDPAEIESSYRNRAGLCEAS